jgi:hypothetical protein
MPFEVSPHPVDTPNILYPRKRRQPDVPSFVSDPAIAAGFRRFQYCGRGFGNQDPASDEC